MKRCSVTNPNTGDTKIISLDAGDEAYFWGCFGPSKYNKGMDDVLSPKYDSGLTDFDDIYCGSFTFVRKGKTVRIYKR